MSGNSKEKALLVKRLSELAERSYSKGIYTFTDFLSLSEQSAANEVMRELSYASPAFFGGTDFSERRILRFGDGDSMGYEEPYPISVIAVRPVAGDFARELNHRDFLGSILNLGVERSVLGDIAVDREKNTGYVFCLETMAEFLSENLIKVKNEKVACEIIDLSSLPEGIEPKTEEKTLSVASPRLDGVIAAAFNLSRSDAQEAVRTGVVFVNQTECQNTSLSLKEGDLVSMRGKGRFIYRGVNYVSRRGRDNITIELFI